jgi:outer membrane protein assembly factor BamB
MRTGEWLVALCTICSSATPFATAKGSGPAENWPQFRGPSGDGHSEAAALPLRWSETEHVAWKTAIHDFGWSSPVIWEKQIWLTTATRDGKNLFAVCLDRESGRTVHDLKVFDVDKPEKISVENSYASPTPVVEPGRVYVHFGTCGTACLDSGTGQVVWARRDLNCDNQWGPGSSPILHDNLLILSMDGIDVQYLVALDSDAGIATCLEAQSGRMVWTERVGSRFWASPLWAAGRIYLFCFDGTTTIIAPGRQYKVLAVNRLPGAVKASPAVAGKALFLRTETSMYRIE